MVEASLVSTLGYPVVVATHMRSGTHLTIDLIRRQFPEFGAWKWPCERNDSVYLPIDSLRQSANGKWSDERIAKVLTRSKHAIAKLHWTDPSFNEIFDAQPAVAQWLQNHAKIIYVVRHASNVMQSLWNWEIAEGTVNNGAGPCPEWLQSRLRTWSDHVARWTGRKDIFVLRFEDLCQTPAACVERLEGFLCRPARCTQPILPPKLKGRWHSRLNRVCSVRPASTEILTTSVASSFSWNATRLEMLASYCGKQLSALGYDI